MLEMILLGLLSSPQTGYDLKRRFREGAAHFWSADLSQIYRTLRRLERRGWLSSAIEPSARGPARRVYARTVAGRRALEAWLRSEPVEPVHRVPYAAQLFFLGELDDLAETEAFLRATRARLGERAAALRALEGEPEDFHIELTWRLGKALAEARVAWCDDALARVRARRPEEASA